MHGSLSYVVLNRYNKDSVQAFHAYRISSKSHETIVLHERFNIESYLLTYGQQHVMLYIHLQFDISANAPQIRAVQSSKCIV
jgi:hypothetical protein